jgi:hypothetical protein
MPNYRRAFVPGGCWFFTANLLDRRSGLLIAEIATWRPGCFRKTGRATSKRLVNLAKHEGHLEPITRCAVVGPHRLEASIEMAQ